MSADFWAGYVSGAIGIIVGNPLDLIKTRLQAGTLNPGSETATITTTNNSNPRPTSQASLRQTFTSAGTLVRGASAPILGYGALNALLFVSYNRALGYLDPAHSPATPSGSLGKIFAAGCVGGLATFVVSAPTELVKCRAQVAREAGGGTATGSFAIAKEVVRARGLRGLYFGGAVTSLRDAVGYGFYFWSYELSRSWLAGLRGEEPGKRSSGAMEVLLCGGLAGMVTWASIFPLDMVKTRVQTQAMGLDKVMVGERSPLLSASGAVAGEEQSLRRHATKGAIQIAREAYRNEGIAVFFRGLGVCTVRGFIVNAVQWFVYEWMIEVLQPVGPSPVRQAMQSTETM